MRQPFADRDPRHTPLYSLGRVPSACGYMRWTCPEPPTGHEPTHHGLTSRDYGAWLDPLPLPVSTPGPLSPRSSSESAAHSACDCGHGGTRNANTARNVHTWSASPAAIAGVQGRQVLAEPLPLV